MEHRGKKLRSVRLLLCKVGQKIIECVSIRNALHLALDVSLASFRLDEAEVVLVWQSERFKDHSKLVGVVDMSIRILQVDRERIAVLPFK